MPERDLAMRILPLVLGSLLGVAAEVNAQEWGEPAPPRQGVCFYEDIDFRGRSFCTAVGATTDGVGPDINDRISSLRVFGRAEVTVFRDVGFRGASRTFTENVRDLRREGFNDRVSSYRVDSLGFTRGGGIDFWGQPERPRAGACFFRNPNFGGDYFCAGMGASVAQVPRGTNDQISSIQVIGNVQVTVFRDADYRGDSRQFDDNVRDLRRSGWNDLVSSYRIEPLRFRGGFSGDRDDRGDRRASRDGRTRLTRSDAQAIVAQAYREVFDRDPDPGAESWVDAVLRNGWTRAQLSAELRRTDEYRARQRPR